jgi:hypothetical protein
MTNNMDYGHDVKNIISILIKKMEQNEKMTNDIARKVNEVELFGKITRESYIKETTDDIILDDLNCIKNLFITNTPSIEEIINNNVNNIVEDENLYINTLF